MNKYPITGVVVVHNGMTGQHNLDKTLKSLEFCTQLIIVDDCSTDGSIEIAKKYTDEIYVWYGCDSMAKRRNYSVGYDDGYWVRNSRMANNYPEVKNDWLIYLDSDEYIYQHSKMPPIEEELDRLIKNEDGFEAGAIQLFNVVRETGEDQTSAGLLRIFKKGKVHWEGDIQHDIKHGQPCGGFPIAVMHYGYGDFEKQQRKFWERLAPLQVLNKENPDTLQRRRYLINNLSGIVQNDKHIEELTAQFFIFKDDFLAGDTEAEDRQAIMQTATRHYWHGMSRVNLMDGWEFAIKDILKYIWWVPDVWMWLMIVYFVRRDFHAVLQSVHIYFKVLRDYNNYKRGVELESGSKQHEICKIMSEACMALGYYEEAKEWDIKFREKV